MAEEQITITFQLSPELDEFVQSLARAATISKSAVLRQILTQAKAEAMARLGEGAKLASMTGAAGSGNPA